MTYVNSPLHLPALKWGAVISKESRATRYLKVLIFGECATAQFVLTYIAGDDIALSLERAESTRFIAVYTRMLLASRHIPYYLPVFLAGQKKLISRK